MVKAWTCGCAVVGLNFKSENDLRLDHAFWCIHVIVGEQRQHVMPQCSGACPILVPILWITYLIITPTSRGTVKYTDSAEERPINPGGFPAYPLSTVLQ